MKYRKAGALWRRQRRACHLLRTWRFSVADVARRSIFRLQRSIAVGIAKSDIPVSTVRIVMWRERILASLRRGGVIVAYIDGLEMLRVSGAMKLHYRGMACRLTSGAGGLKGSSSEINASHRARKRRIIRLQLVFDIYISTPINYLALNFSPAPKTHDSLQAASSCSSISICLYKGGGPFDDLRG